MLLQLPFDGIVNKNLSIFTSYNLLKAASGNCFVHTLCRKFTKTLKYDFKLGIVHILRNIFCEEGVGGGVTFNA